MPKTLTTDFFARDTLTVARELLGVKLVYNGCEGIIVETEAYKDDAASHAVTRPLKGAMLRDTHGCIYIYLIYGMYHCLNFTTEDRGVGAVLIRAIEPIAGIDAMKVRRGDLPLHSLASGPGKLFKAFGFDVALHGETIGKSIQLLKPARRKFEIISGPRIGISKATDLPWRFLVAGSQFVSR
jgi:DNA-3-methyladenine glycosylase